MVQWINRLRNNIFVSPPLLPLLCEISGALHLAQPGLTAGGRQADEMQVNFEIFKTNCTPKHSIFRSHLAKVQHHYSSINAFQVLFSGKVYWKVVF